MGTRPYSMAAPEPGKRPASLTRWVTGVTKTPDDVLPVSRSYAEMLNYLRWEEEWAANTSLHDVLTMVRSSMGRWRHSPLAPGAKPGLGRRSFGPYPGGIDLPIATPGARGFYNC